MKAMILAAGFGTRLRPYSLIRPKPLFPVLDRPLLLHLIEQLQGAGFGPLLVNAHHLKEQIIALLEDRQGVTVQQEPMELGTGGGLRMAHPFFGREPVLVTNGDIFHTIDLTRVAAEHEASGAAATLVLHDCPRFNKVAVDENGLIRSFGGRGPGRKLAFTGIHVVDPALLEVIPSGSFYNIIDCYRYWIERGAPIRALVVSDIFWSDMGTPADYLRLHETLLKDGVPPGRSPFHVGKEVTIPEDCQLVDWAAIGSRAAIGRDCRLERVVVWDGALVADGTREKDRIIV